MIRRIVQNLAWLMTLALLCVTCYGIGRTVTVVKFADKLTDVIFEIAEKKELKAYLESEVE